MSRAEVCHCGHDRATHFLHEGKYVTCLGVSCDCETYVHRDDPKPVKPAPPLPKFHVDDGWDDASPVTHKTGCTCAVCTWGSWGRYWP